MSFEAKHAIPKGMIVVIKNYTTSCSIVYNFASPLTMMCRATHFGPAYFVKKENYKSLFKLLEGLTIYITSRKVLETLGWRNLLPYRWSVKKRVELTQTIKTLVTDMFMVQKPVLEYTTPKYISDDEFELLVGRYDDSQPLTSSLNVPQSPIKSEDDPMFTAE
jgi:hypothetical protein